jgi:glycosyltransferase involved in cell wall biosynthesis
MRVLHICPTYFGAGSVIAGGERYSHGLANARARRVPTTLVTFGDSAFERRDGDLTVRCYRRWTYVKGNRMNPLSPAFLRDLLAVDVVHCHQFRTVCTDLALIGGILARKKVFVTDLGGGTDFALSNYLPLGHGIRALLLISEFNRTLFRNLAVQKSVIYGGVEIDRFHPGSGTRTPRILFVGRLMPHKGVDVLIQALDPDMELDVVGQVTEPAYGAALRAASEGKRVTFHDDWSDERLLEAYQGAAVVAIPSLVDGGYTTALEAMACETPVVGSTVGSLPELVKDGETGFTVAPSDPDALRERLRRVLADNQLATEMGRAGRRRVEREFTWDRVVDRCLDAYGA